MPGPGAVVVSLNGGVGNQLFQYAAGRAIAERRAMRLQVVPARAAASRSIGVADLLDVPALALTARERLLCGLPGATFASAPPAVRRVVRALAKRRAGYRELHQTLMQMADPAPDPAADPGGRAAYLQLRGFFQHPSYYEPVLDAIVGEIVERLGARLDAAAGAGVVAVHFRRGDYLLHGYDLPLSFQEEAVTAIAARASVASVLVMSDDRDFAVLAAEHFERRGLPARAAVGAPGATEIDDLCALAAAQHLVMSNSTFVWWAAVVGDRLRAVPGRAEPSDRVVVCPTPWMPGRASGTIPSAALDLSRTGWLLHPVAS